MAYSYRAMRNLCEGAVGTPLYRDWLGDGIPDSDHRSRWQARAELERSLRSNADAVAPRWTFDWKPLVAPGERDVPGMEPYVGRYDTVITGQQPGLLGGPLYTLYKIATTIALAQRRTSANRETIPVFWSADDDDDQAEAFQAVAWSPERQEVLTMSAPPVRGGRRPGPVGDLAVSGPGAGVITWLEALAAQGDGALGGELVGLYHQARDEDWSWARLQAAILGRVFSGHDLMIVSGNDPNLHRAAGEIYQRILSERGALADAARRRGAELIARGWHAQISERSLARPLFRMDQGRRVPLDPDQGCIEYSSLRPGVLLRSPVQDWLIRPAGVVVGPGELAYLRQLDPVYTALGIPCPPRIPRLTGWLAPPRLDPRALADPTRDSGPDSGQLDAWADRAADAAAAAVRQVLARELDVEKSRAVDLAAGRARRFRKGVRALLEAEAIRKSREIDTVGPAWLVPQGARQERKLGSYAAAARWGEDLISVLIQAADSHLQSGLYGDWSEYLIEVE